MNNCLICKHRESLVNQGVHWCGLQIEGFPNVEDCKQFEDIPISVTVVSTSSNVWHSSCQGCEFYESTTAVDMKKTCNDCINKHKGYY